jgi:hypothetical protein
LLVIFVALPFQYALPALLPGGYLAQLTLYSWDAVFDMFSVALALVFLVIWVVIAAVCALSSALVLVPLISAGAHV